MNKKLSLSLIISLVILTLGSLAFTDDLAQRNSEYIFLTSESAKSYTQFQEDFNLKSVVVAQSPIGLKFQDQAKKIMRDHCSQKSERERDQDDDEGDDNPCFHMGFSDLPQDIKLPFNLISQNGQTQAHLFFAPHGSDALKKTLHDLLKSWPRARFAGVPYTNILLDEYSESIKKILFPALFGAVFLLLCFLFRSLITAVILFFPPLMGAAISLLATKLIFGHSTLITSIIPLLLFIINLSLSLHLHHTAVHVGSMRNALTQKKAPIFLMAFTTFIGFGSLYFSNLQAISDFGLLSSLLFVVTTLLCLLWSYVLGERFPKLWREKEVVEAEANEESILRHIKGLSSPWSNLKIITFSLVALILGMISLPEIPIITDATEYFPAHRKIKETMIEMAKELSGTPILEIVIKSDDLTYKKIKEIALLENKLKENIQGQIISSAQLVSMANLVYSKSESLPQQEMAFATLYSKTPEALREGYPIDTEEGYRITVLGAPMNIEHYEDFLSAVKNIFSELNADIEFNGLFYHLMIAQKKMISTLFKSFSLSLVIISFAALVFFKNLGLFFIFLIVNTIPVFASFPLIYLLGTSFNVATVMTYSVSLGLIVDSSFHIIHALKEGYHLNQKKDFYFNTIIVPVIQSSLLLSLCFAFFGLNNFLPIKEFGITLSILIFFGMILDLKVLPTLFLGKKQKEK